MSNIMKICNETMVRFSKMACALLFFVFGKSLYALTWNVARPYSDDSREISMPSFSRERENLIFEKGDKIEIYFFPKKRPYRVEWKISYNMIEVPFMEGRGETCIDRSVKVTLNGEKLSPGFYDLRVKVYMSESQWEDGLSTFGYRIDEIGFTDSFPSDFDDFWKKAKTRLYAEPLDPHEKFICEMDDNEISAYNPEKASRPEDYDPEGKVYSRIRVYKINFNVSGDRFYGWLTLPAGKGPFPGLLIVPGAGIGRRPIPAEQARHGFATLMLEVHPGLDVDMEKYPKIPEYMKYIRQGYPEKITDEYYYRMFLGCAQAVNYLKSRIEIDPGRIAVAGQSQGGMLAVVTAGLCPEVKAAVSCLTGFGYRPFYDHFAKLNSQKSNGIPEMFNPPFSPDDRRQKYLSYYDTMNFARRVKCPVIVLSCLCDRITPVTAVYASFRNLGNPASRIFFSPNTNHDFIIAFEKIAWRWLDEVLK